MAKTLYTKNQEVTLFGEWSHAGAMYTRRCVVAACGQKRMTLVDAVSGECVGRDFKPEWCANGHPEGYRFLTRVVDGHGDISEQLTAFRAGDYEATKNNCHGPSALSTATEVVDRTGERC